MAALKELPQLLAVLCDGMGLIDSTQEIKGGLFLEMLGNDLSDFQCSKAKVAFLSLLCIYPRVKYF
jgi:hypothetical protein